MSKYTILTFLGLAIIIVLYIVDYFIYDVPLAIQSVISIIAAVLMIVGLYYRGKENKQCKK